MLTFAGAVARLVFAALAIFAFSAAEAAVYITFVASNGNDANPCTVITAPCKTLQRAVTVTSANGSVRVLSPLTSSVFINKNITISGDGVPIVGQITIGGATAVVTLRGLALNGVGGYVNGIRINSAAAVHIEDCTVERYTSNGIKLEATPTATRLFVSDTVSRDNGGTGFLVIDGNAGVTIENSRFEGNDGDGLYLKVLKANVVRSAASGNNNIGMQLYGGTATITEATATDNTYDGFYFEGSASATLASSVARGNLSGVVLAAATAVSLTKSIITSNTNYAIYNSGTLYTRQNNILGGSYGGNAALTLTAF